MAQYMPKLMAKLLPLLLTAEAAVDDDAVHSVPFDRCASDIGEMQPDVQFRSNVDHVELMRLFDRQMLVQFTNILFQWGELV